MKLICETLLVLQFALGTTSLLFADQVEGLIKIVSEASQPETKIAAIQLLGDIGDDRAVTLLLEQAKLADSQVRFSSIKSLGRIGTPQARAALTELERTGDSELQNAALIALAMAKDPNVRSLAEEGLQSPSWTARWYSILALDILGDPQTAPVLETALTDPHQLSAGGRYPVREAAQAALDRLKSSIQWSYALSDAIQRSGVEKKPVLAYFYINGGEWCEQFERESFTDHDIQALFSKFAPVRINAYSQAEISERFQVEGTPTLLILDQQGNEFSRLPGYVPAERVKSYLQESLEALGEKGGKAEFWIKAQSFVEQGDYQSAITALEVFLSGEIPTNLSAREEWARFMLALAYGKAENYPRSKEFFVRFTKQYPNSDLMDKALYCLSLAELHLGRRDLARQTLTDLLARFPDSAVVKQAQNLLNQILEIS